MKILEDFFNKYVHVRYVIFLILVTLFLLFIFCCKDIAIMFFATFVIACSINPIVDKLEKKMNRHLATVLVTFIITFIILAILVPVCLLSFEQIKTFMHKLPHYIDHFDEYLLGLPLLKQFHFLANDADDVMEQISLSSSDVLSKVMDIGAYAGTAFMYMFVSVIIIFNMVADKAKIKNYYLKIFPSSMRKRAEEVGKIISDKMGGYLVALLATSSSVGVVMLLGLLILKIPYAILLALISAIFDIVPVIGPALALIVCVIAVYPSGSSAVIGVIVIFALSQLIENNLVRPYIFGKVMNIHPIVIFLFLFLAADYMGIVGVVFAPAIAALVAVLFEELYLKKVN
ncbi:AI-2E family transporter [bacterium]|nr:AI-2E family transporter [bacterium]